MCTDVPDILHSHHHSLPRDNPLAPSKLSFNTRSGCYQVFFIGLFMFKDLRVLTPSAPVHIFDMNIYNVDYINNTLYICIYLNLYRLKCIYPAFSCPIFLQSTFSQAQNYFSLLSFRNKIQNNSHQLCMNTKTPTEDPGAEFRVKKCR